ncbi:MAG: VWA domain-containing protein [Acidobacteriota bacterium]
MRIAICTLMVACCLAVSAQEPKSTADQDVDVIRVDTDLVLLPIRVRDRHGKFFYGLDRDAFRVFEDGVEQEIAYFDAPAEPQNEVEENPSKPLTIALMLDISDSTQFKLQQIQNTALAFVSLLRPSDRVIVIAFDKGFYFLSQATADRAVLRAAISRLKSGGGTSLYSALDATITKLNSLGGRKVIVLLTDGVDTSSTGITSDNTIRAAEQSYVSIYPIQYQTYGDFADNPSRETYAAWEFGRTAHVTKSGEPASEAYKRATRYLRLLADKTSGHFQYSDGPKNLARSFERIAAELRQQYALGYYPKNKSATAKPRTIKVTVLAPQATVETRKTYIYKRAKD